MMRIDVDSRVIVPGASPDVDGLAIRSDSTPLLWSDESEVLRSLADIRLADPATPRLTPPSLIVLTDRRLVWVDPTAGKPTGLLALLGGARRAPGGQGSMPGAEPTIAGLHLGGLLRRGAPTEVLAGQRWLEHVDRLRVRPRERRVEVDELVLTVDRSADIRALVGGLRKALGAPVDADDWSR